MIPHSHAPLRHSQAPLPAHQNSNNAGQNVFVIPHAMPPHQAHQSNMDSASRLYQQHSMAPGPPAQPAIIPGQQGMNLMTPYTHMTPYMNQSGRPPMMTPSASANILHHQQSQLTSHPYGGGIQQNHNIASRAPAAAPPSYSSHMNASAYNTALAVQNLAALQSQEAVRSMPPQFHNYPNVFSRQPLNVPSYRSNYRPVNTSLSLAQNTSGNVARASGVQSRRISTPSRQPTPPAPAQQQPASRVQHTAPVPAAATAAPAATTAAVSVRTTERSAIGALASITASIYRSSGQGESASVINIEPEGRAAHEKPGYLGRSVGGAEGTRLILCTCTSICAILCTSSLSFHPSSNKHD